MRMKRTKDEKREGKKEKKLVLLTGLTSRKCVKIAKR